MQAEIAVRAAPSVAARRAVVWGAPILVVLVFAVLTAANPDELLVGLAYGVGTATVALIGAVLAGRAPGNRIGPWLLVGAMLMTLGVVLDNYGIAGQAASPPWPGAAGVALLSNIPDVIGVVIILIGVPAIFPTGTLLSARWRLLVWIMVVAVVATCVSHIIGASPVADTGARSFSDALSAISFGFGIIGALASVVIRFRRGSPVEREQAKWFLAATVFAVIVTPLAFTTPGDTPFGVILLMLALVAQPVAIGIAVLRYRLYAIDRIVSRTIAYVLITAVLVIVYGLLVLALRAAVGGLIGDGSAEVVISTLVVASLFQPVRSRVQSSVDHRFDRRRYDAERTVAAFSGRLRDEVHLDAVAGGLVAAVRTSVAPTTSGIWLRSRGSGDR